MTTQNDCKRSRNPMKMVSDVIIQIFGLISVIWGLFWPFLATFSQFWPQTQNCFKLVMWPLKMTAREAEIHWRWFQMAISMGSGHFRPSCVILGPKMATMGSKITLFFRNDLDVLKVTSETISIRFLLVLQSFWGVTRPVCDNFMFGPKNGS